MSAVNDVIAAVQQSDKLNPEVKQLVTAFLQAGAPAIEGLESEAIADLMALLSGTVGGTGTDLVTAGLDEHEVTEALTEDAAAMKEIADQRAAAAAQERATITALGDAALSVLAKAVIGVL